MTGEKKTSYLCFKGYIQQNIIKCNSMPLGAAWAYYMLGKSSRTR